jgi:hypothetical protein
MSPIPYQTFSTALLGTSTCGFTQFLVDSTAIRWVCMSEDLMHDTFTFPANTRRPIRPSAFPGQDITSKSVRFCSPVKMSPPDAAETAGRRMWTRPQLSLIVIVDNGRVALTRTDPLVRFVCGPILQGAT